jgi:hypothetical protein
MDMAFSGDGHLLVMPNSIPPGEGASVWTVDIDLVALTKRNITEVQNCQTICFGAPLITGGPRALYMVGWKTNDYAVHLSFDRMQTAPVKSFEHILPEGSQIKHISAHPTRFGELGVALSGGHGRGRVVSKA